MWKIPLGFFNVMLTDGLNKSRFIKVAATDATLE